MRLLLICSKMGRCRDLLQSDRQPVEQYSIGCHDTRIDLEVSLELTVRGKSRRGIRPGLHPGGLRCSFALLLFEFLTFGKKLP